MDTSCIMSDTRRLEAILDVKGMREEVGKFIIEKGYERGSQQENMELDREYPGLGMGYGIDLDSVIGEMLEEKGSLVFNFFPEEYHRTHVSVFFFLNKFFQEYESFDPVLQSNFRAIDYPADDLKPIIDELFDDLNLCAKNGEVYFFPDNYTPHFDGTGEVETEYLLNLCAKHTKIGRVIEVNAGSFEMTERGFLAVGM